MADIALILGPVLFQDFEIPSTINFGGRQRVVTHRLPGGARIIDALGRDDAQISFGGIFTGSDATLRARILDELRSAGTPLPITWDVFFFTVLIAEFHADYRNGWWIPYHIGCTVLQDEAALPLEAPISLAAAATADIAAATGLALDAGIDVSQLQPDFAAPGATTQGTTAFTRVQTSLAATQSVIGGAMYQANGMVQGTDLAGFVSAQDGVAGLLAATSAMGQLSSLSTASAHIGRLAVNLRNAGT